MDEERALLMCLLGTLHILFPCLFPCLFLCLFGSLQYLLLNIFWGTLQGTASTTPPINGNEKGVVSKCCPSTSPFPDSPRIFGLMPTTNETTPPGRSFPDHAKEMTDAARRRAQKTQSKRRRRAELTPSNKDLDKTQNTQSRRRRRAELSPEDKDQANEERRVKRRIDKESKEVTTAQGQDRQVKARAAKTRALASIQAVHREAAAQALAMGLVRPPERLVAMFNNGGADLSTATRRLSTTKRCGD